MEEERDSMFCVYKEEVVLGDQTLVLETGRLARQAHGSVLVSCGETSVLATVCVNEAASDVVDFLPLSVHYQEKFYAVGRVPGGFFKREGRPTESEILISRLIDRPIRPLFEKGFHKEMQVIVNLLSYDLNHQPDVLAIIAASAALALSGAPFISPIAAARVGYINEEFVLNPSSENTKKGGLDLVVAGNSESIMMVESEAHELSEGIMLEAVMFGQKSFAHIIEAIQRLVKKCGRKKLNVPQKVENIDFTGVKDALHEGLANAYQEPDKIARRASINALRNQLISTLKENNEETFSQCGESYFMAAFSSFFKEMERSIVRNQIITSRKRIDGRDPETIRPIECQVGILPKTHGSALFTRGETQALVTTTLGTEENEQLIDALEGEYKQRFMLHYNFPPFSVGETGRLGGTGRREIGHGKLAWRAIHPLLPSEKNCPYTVRVVSEILESNGSSSMATVCGASLSMMDAGVALSKPISGIAMGLIQEADQTVILSDILGDEDYLGDMDFKVAGTKSGITALQMDIKITGISRDIIRAALEQAKNGRIHILDEMNRCMAHARKQVKGHAPRIEFLKIDPEKIREVIGSGGKVIRDIIEKTGAKIDVSDDGSIKIASAVHTAIKAAVDRIKGIVSEPETGVIYDGTVVKIVDFGVFVNFFGERDGLVHISQISEERVENVSDLLRDGQKVKVKVVGFDDRGKVRLSMRQVNQKTGEDLGDGGDHYGAGGGEHRRGGGGGDHHGGGGGSSDYRSRKPRSFTHESPFSHGGGGDRGGDRDHRRNGGGGGKPRRRQG